MSNRGAETVTVVAGLLDPLLGRGLVDVLRKDHRPANEFAERGFLVRRMANPRRPRGTDAVRQKRNLDFANHIIDVGLASQA